MPQSMTKMPEEADFDISLYPVTIWNHKVEQLGGLLGVITGIIRDENMDRNTLYQFEEHGISFETAIEECVCELENNTDTLGNIVAWNKMHGKTTETLYKDWDDACKFSKGVTGRNIAEQYIEKIRSCNNWDELYDEMQQTSKFSKYMGSQMMAGVKEQCRKV